MEKLKHFQVGDKIQFVPWDNNTRVKVRDGIVLEVIPAKKAMPDDYWKYPDKEQDDFYDTLKIKWDDSNRSKKISAREIEPRDTELEREFRSLVPEVNEKIIKYLDQANTALREAERLSEYYSVPFYSNISRISQGYVPRTFKSRYGKVNDNLISSLTNCWQENKEWNTGWETSAICR